MIHCMEILLGNSSYGNKLMKKTGFDTIEIPTNKGEQHAVN